MAEFRLDLEMINGITKTLEINHDELMDFQRLINQEKVWFKHGTSAINLDHVSYYKFSSIEKNEQEQDDNDESYVLW